jgi:hypothetical protein
VRFTLLFVLIVSLNLSFAWAQERALTAQGAMIRTLDRVSGKTVDFEFAPGQRHEIGKLQIEMSECRYPVNNPSGDAFARLVIRQKAAPEPVFQGWMIASSPAISALDHARYDVWVLRCII